MTTPLPPNDGDGWITVLEQAQAEGRPGALTRTLGLPQQPQTIGDDQ